MITTLLASQLLTADGWRSDCRLRLEAGRIISIDENAVVQPGEERHAAVVPAIANLHSHAFQRAMAGLAEKRSVGKDDFWSWREAMYRVAARMSPPQLEAVAAQAYVEMLESGFGRVGEFHYLHRDVDGHAYADAGEMAARIAAAAAQSGIALTLLPVFYAHSAFGGAAPGANQRRFVCSLDEYAALLERCRAIVTTLPEGRAGVAPHSLRAVTPEELQAVLALAGPSPIHIHIAEQIAEVRDCISWCGDRPVRWLLEHAPVDQRWCLVHATHVDHGEVAAMAASGACVGLCPITEANLGDGIFPTGEFLGAGGRIGVGSDSNVYINMASELALLEYSQRLQRRVRNVVSLESLSTGRALFQRAALGGGVAVGGQPQGIAAGAAADLVSLVTDDAAMVCRNEDALLDAWIFASPRNVVDCVWVAGTKIVQAGRHCRRDSIRREFDKSMAELCS